MLHPKYLNLLAAVPVKSMRGIYAIQRPEISGERYFVATYQTFKNFKFNFFTILKLYGQEENIRDWDAHHIIEKDQLKYFYEEPQLSKLYNETWPCVWLHNIHHHAYNRVFRSAGTKIMFPLASAPGRSRDACIANLISLYSSVYSGNSVLTRIAENVIMDVKATALKKVN